jgi:Nucleotidyl transferase AbiEii toxin, Type IV TA system
VIHQNVIKRRADEDRLPAPAVERDYVLAHVLTAVSERDDDQQLAFKGGTSLRLCHFTDYRYSADLDFSLTGGVDAEGATRLIAEALVNCRERVGFPLLELDERNPSRIGYIGPLGAKPRFVKLDLADGELVEHTTVLPIRRRYEDQGDDIDAEAVWPLFERKAHHRDREPGRFGESFDDRVPRWEERWDRELIEYIASPPEFDGVLRSVRRELRFALG